ncbi:MAG: ABC transporter ATP-binding protein [Lachnospira sp.]
MADLIKIEGLRKCYGRRQVIGNMNLTLESGKIIGILGPNGSGKSTLIKLLGGVLKSNAGTITIDGHEISPETKAIVSYLPERTYLSTSMRVKDAINFFADFYKDFSKDKAYDMLKKFNIDPKDRIKSLSKGTREKVQLVLVMSRDAKVYLLDEPMGGVDPAARDYILKTIISNYNEDATVIITTHLISDIENVLDEVVFIKEGDIVLQDSVDNIRSNNNKSVDGLFREVFACF